MKGDGLRKGSSFVEFALENILELISNIESDKKPEPYTIFTVYIDNYNAFAIAEDLEFYKGSVEFFAKEDIPKRLSEDLFLYSIYSTMVTAMNKILASRVGSEALIETSGFNPETYEILFDMSALLMQMLVTTVESGKSLQVESLEPAKKMKGKKVSQENLKIDTKPYTIKNLTSLQHYQAERSRFLISLFEE